MAAKGAMVIFIVKNPWVNPLAQKHNISNL